MPIASTKSLIQISLQEVKIASYCNIGSIIAPEETIFSLVCRGDENSDTYYALYERHDSEYQLRMPEHANLPDLLRDIATAIQIGISVHWPLPDIPED